ncbi:MAG TPA: aminoglycoside phosphotransferase family protein [Casimicrobiaceae bacterium]
MPRRRAARVDPRALARAVMEHHLGAAPRRVAPAHGGLQNDVLEVAHAEGDFVIRIGRVPEKLNAYLKEQWSMKRAREVGVPVPEVLEVGNEAIGRPYMVARRVEGRPGTQCEDRPAVLRAMGALAARIHTIRTTGFGATFDWSHNRLSHNATLRAFLQRELCVASRLATLERLRMLDAARLERLAKLVRSLSRNRMPSTLNHGDLRLKNVMVDDRDRIVALIDWDEALACAGPAWDLAIALHDLSIDEKDAFTRGYGLDARALRTHRGAMRAFNLLNYAPKAEELAGRRDREGLAALRLRLSGAFDLYAMEAR